MPNNFEAIIQSEDAAMQRLAELSAVPPQTVFPTERFMDYTDQYLDLLTKATLGLARLHPKWAGTRLSTSGGLTTEEYNHQTSESAHEAWYDGRLQQPRMLNQLLLEPPNAEGYPLQVRIVQGLTVFPGNVGVDFYCSVSMFVLQDKMINSLQMTKPYCDGSNVEGKVHEGGYIANMSANNKEGLYTFSFVTNLDAPQSQGKADIAACIPDEREAEAYRQHGHEGLFVMRLWRMGGWLCAKAGIAQPDMN